MPPKILVADYHTLARKGTALFLKMIFPNAILYEASDGLEVIKLSNQKVIDLYILDYRMPRMNGYTLSNALLKRNPSSKIIIMTSYNSDALAITLFELGIKGYVAKNASTKEIETCIKDVIVGRHYFTVPEAMKSLAPIGDLPCVQFTLNELRLVKALASGLTTKQIADRGKLSYKSIETYRSRLFKKTKVKNTSELISYMYKIGELDL